MSGVQLIEQRLRLFQIERLEAFGEPAIDRGEEIASRITLARPERDFAGIVGAELNDVSAAGAADLACIELPQRIAPQDMPG